jgi:DNA-binding transcriptional LysR family regulator
LKNFDRLDLNLLRTLVAIYDTGSVTLAGQRLALSQPATSHGLGRLREFFDDQLFVRSPQGLIPTSLAQSLVPAVNSFLDALQQSLTAPGPFDSQHSHLQLRLSLSDLGEITFLPKLVAHLRQAAPKVQIHNLSVALAEVRKALDSQQNRM